MKVIDQFTGGSLAGTFLCQNDDGEKFVRKQVSTVLNREYGYQRWYSQLKRLQRYNAKFPGLYPSVLRFSVDQDKAYFDMEYIEGAVTAHQFLSWTNYQDDLDMFFSAFVSMLGIIHAESIPSHPSGIKLYFDQEVKRSLNLDYLRWPMVFVNGVEVPSIVFNLESLKHAMMLAYKEDTETTSHGNLTLENILYVPEQRRIVLIDPYEENAVDSRLADYSQILQSCRSHYEIINKSPFTVTGDEITFELPKISSSMTWFLDKFSRLVLGGLSPDQQMAVDLFEVTQYIRMLPFKQRIDPKRAMVFYGVACVLYNDFCKKHG